MLLSDSDLIVEFYDKLVVIIIRNNIIIISN